jgi:hypothetical protein
MQIDLVTENSVRHAQMISGGMAGNAAVACDIIAR